MYMTIYQIKEDIYLDYFEEVDSIPKDTYIAELAEDEQQNILNTFLENKFNIFHGIVCSCENKPHCLITFKNPQNTNEFLQINDIDQIFTILVEAGFKIEYEMTKLLKKKNNKLICFVSK